MWVLVGGGGWEQCKHAEHGRRQKGGIKHKGCWEHRNVCRFLQALTCQVEKLLSEEQSERALLQILLVI